MIDKCPYCGGTKAYSYMTTKYTVIHDLKKGKEVKYDELIQERKYEKRLYCLSCQKIIMKNKDADDDD